MCNSVGQCHCDVTCVQVCNSVGQCHCDVGFSPPDCSQPGAGGSNHSNPATIYPPRKYGRIVLGWNAYSFAAFNHQDSRTGVLRSEHIMWGVYFAYMGRRNPLTDWAHFLVEGIHDVITHARFGDDRLRGSLVVWGSKFSISHWLCWSSLQHSHTTVWVCDIETITLSETTTTTLSGRTPVETTTTRVKLPVWYGRKQVAPKVGLLLTSWTQQQRPCQLTSLVWMLSVCLA